MSIRTQRQKTISKGSDDLTRLTDIHPREVSLVDNGANGKRFLLVKVGSQTQEIQKGAVPYASFPKADEDYGWDADSAVKRLRAHFKGEDDSINWSEYKKCFLWKDDDQAEDVLESYKMPVCDVIDGEVKVVWKAVVAANAAMSGARAGVDIPDSGRPAVEARIKKYYEDFDKEYDEKSSQEEKNKVSSDLSGSSPVASFVLDDMMESLELMEELLPTVREMIESTPRVEKAYSEIDWWNDEDLALLDIPQKLSAQLIALNSGMKGLMWEVPWKMKIKKAASEAESVEDFGHKVIELGQSEDFERLKMVDRVTKQKSAFRQKLASLATEPNRRKKEKAGTTTPATPASDVVHEVPPPNSSPGNGELKQKKKESKAWQSDDLSELAVNNPLRKGN